MLIRTVEVLVYEILGRLDSFLAQARNIGGAPEARMNRDEWRSQRWSSSRSQYQEVGRMKLWNDQLNP